MRTTGRRCDSASRDIGETEFIHSTLMWARMTELVSIITPTYNSEEYMGHTIESVQAQTYEAWELIVVDDGSSDGTCQLVADAAVADSRIKFFKSEENKGAAAARNKAIQESSGRYIAFLDSDDLWREDKLARQLAFMAERRAVLSYTAYEKIDERGARQGRVISVPDKIDYRGLLRASIIGCLTAVYDTKELGKVYMPEIRRRQDYGLWLKILRQGEMAHGLNVPLAFLRKRNESLSSNKLLSAYYVWKLFREVEGLRMIPSMYYFANYAARALRKAAI